MQESGNLGHPRSPRGSRIRALDRHVKGAFLSNDVFTIGSILQYSLYGNKSRLRRLLSESDLMTQSEILAKDDIIGKAPAQSPAGPDTVELIVGIHEPCEREFSITSEWQPFTEEFTKDPQKIAESMDMASRRIFARPEFKEWTRVSAGYDSTEIDMVRSGHAMMSYRLSTYLLRHHKERPKYYQVAEILRGNNSMACQVVLFALREPRPPKWPHTIIDLNFVITPLREFLSQKNFYFTLRALPLLEIRFGRLYRCTDIEPMGHIRPFETRLSVYSDISSQTSKDVVARWTALDEAAFKQLPGSTNGEARAHRLKRTWDNLMHEYAECAIAYPFIAGVLLELAPILEVYRNWYRLSALILALQETPFIKPFAPRLFELMNPSERFIKLHQLMKSQPGLPFLISNKIESAPDPYRGEGASGCSSNEGINHPTEIPKTLHSALPVSNENSGGAHSSDPDTCPVEKRDPSPFPVYKAAKIIFQA